MTMRKFVSVTFFITLLFVVAPAGAAELVNQDGIGTWPVSCLQVESTFINVVTCDGSSVQQWSWSPAGELVDTNGRCLSIYSRTYDANGDLVEIVRNPIFDRTPAKPYPCDGAEDQRWRSEEGRIYAIPLPELQVFHPVICLGFQRQAPAGGPSRVIGNNSVADCDDSFYFWAIDQRPVPAANTDLFGFEDVFGGWSSPSVVLSSVANATEGANAMGVPARGYTEVDSVPFATDEMPGSGNRIAVDFFLPLNQPNAYWYGTLEIVFVVPSAGLWHEYLGLVDLLSLAGGEGQYHTLTFNMTPALANVFANGADDAAIKIFLNVPQEAISLYLFDNLRRVP